MEVELLLFLKFQKEGFLKVGHLGSLNENLKKVYIYLRTKFYDLS